MAKRRDNRAPFEVMGVNTPGARPVPEVERDLGPPAVAAWRGALDWWQAGTPVVLRLPRGWAVLLGVALIGLIVLAYWTGHSRGYTAAEVALGQQETEIRTGRAPVELPVGAGDEMVQATPVAPPAVRDGRQPGKNYLMLALYPESEALRLQRFLAARGVETWVVPSNNGLFHVVGTKGYTREERSAGADKDYYDLMRRLGRDWQAANDGRGLNLSDMYWALYEG